MENIDDLLNKMIESKELKESEYLKELEMSYSSSEEGSSNVSLLGKRAIELLKKDIHQKTRQKQDNLIEEEKVEKINETHTAILSIKGNSINNKLRTFLSTKEDMNSYSSRCTRIKNFCDSTHKDYKLNTTSIYAMACKLSVAMSEKEIIPIKYYDINNYLIDKKVCNEFKPKTVKKIEGNYLLIRRSERSKNAINIAHFGLTYDFKNKVFTFKSERKGFIKGKKEELEEIKTEGIFFQNTADTYVFLCKSKASGEFSFVETITTIRNRRRSEDKYVLGIFNGNVISKDEFDSRPFSSEVVFIKVDKSEKLLGDLKALDLLRDHRISEILEISEKIDNGDYSYEDTKWGNTLSEIDKIANLSLILSKITNEINKERGVFILNK